MFDETLVVASAVSAFNNMAVATPVFLWNAVLCLPIFVGIYLFVRNFSDKFGIQSYVTIPRMSFWTVLMTALWVVLMGGNYAVLRDGVSLLPWLTGAILFVASIYIGINTRVIALPVWYGSQRVSKRNRWLINLAVLLVCLVPVGLSGLINWWGPILQVLAVIFGLLLGRYSGRQMRSTTSTLMVIFGTAVAILMQPELWRFGQLGNLTPAHLLGILSVGIFIAIAMALHIVSPRGRIHQSAYVKLKWLMRFVTLLCAVLFCLTEAVPIFIATVVAMFILVGMSVWHAHEIKAELPGTFFAWSIILFGILIGVPTIAAIGITWIAIPSNKFHGGFQFLL